MWLEQVESIKKSPNPDRVKNTIFEGVLSSKLPEEEKSNARLAHEAQLVVFAGQGTTGKLPTPLPNLRDTYLPPAPTTQPTP
jgi:hypothetical protein